MIFSLRQIFLAIWIVAMMLGLARLGMAGIALFPVVVPLAMLCTGLLTNLTVAQQRSDRWFLLIYGITLMVLSLLMLGSLQFLLFRKP